MICPQVQTGKFLTVKPVYEHFVYLWIMRAISAIFFFYVRGSIHVSVALVALLHASAQRYAINLPWAYYCVLFLGGIAGYNAIKTMTSGHWPFRDFRGGGPAIRVLSFISALIATVCLLFLEFKWVISLAMAALLTAIYAIPILPGFRNLRSFGMLKVVWVAAVWTMITLLIPLIKDGRMHEPYYWIVTGQRFLWMGLLMLPFEIRDAGTDPDALLTFPRRLGISRTRILGWAVTGLLVLATVSLEAKNTPVLVSDLTAFFLTGCSIQFSSTNRGPYFAAFWVEAIPIAFWALQMALML
ncbi:MAG: hypothetical protein RLZZ241_542 [Bacteroidota bacterium]|jgi:hypothetical protein